MTWRATWRSRTRSWARQNRPPPLSVSRSTNRYRSASTSPGRIELGTQLPSSDLPGQAVAAVAQGHRRARSVPAWEGQPTRERVDHRRQLREPDDAGRSHQHQAPREARDDEGERGREPAAAVEQLVEEVRRTPGCGDRGDGG